MLDLKGNWRLENVLRTLREPRGRVSLSRDEADILLQWIEHGVPKDMDELERVVHGLAEDLQECISDRDHLRNSLLSLVEAVQDLAATANRIEIPDPN